MFCLGMNNRKTHFVERQSEYGGCFCSKKSWCYVLGIKVSDDTNTEVLVGQFLVNSNNIYRVSLQLGGGFPPLLLFMELF